MFNVKKIVYIIAIFFLFFIIGGCKITEFTVGGEAVINPENDGEILYTFHPISAGFYYNPPTVVDDYIYIGTSRRFREDPSNKNTFLKLDLKLNKVWEYQLGNREVRGGATLDTIGNIYFVVEEGRHAWSEDNSVLYLYSIDNFGNFRWMKKIADDISNLGMVNPAITENDTILIGGNKFYAFDSNGNLIWSYGNGMKIMNAPVIDKEGNIYFNSRGGIISLDREGNKRWKVETNSEDAYYSSPAFSVDYSKIYVGVGNHIYCINTMDGKILWVFTSMENSGDFKATPAVDDYDNVYVGTKGNEKSIFYSIDSKGSLRWKVHIGGDLYSSPVLGENRVLYVGSELSRGEDVPQGCNLHAINMDTGKVLWSKEFNTCCDMTWSSPVLLDNGYLIISRMSVVPSYGDFVNKNSDDEYPGTLQIIQTSSHGLLIGAGSPRFHESNENTGRRPW